MQYQLTATETVGHGLARIMHETLCAATEQLHHGEENPGKSIHECRKYLKKTRSLAKLIPPGTLSDTRRADLRALRDAAHLLAPLREQDAHLECIKGLAAFTTDTGVLSTLTSLETTLSVRHGVLPAQDTSCAPLMLEVQEMIAATAARLAEWVGADCDRRTLKKGLKRSYRRAHYIVHHQWGDGNIQTVHQLRKRTKDLRYQTEIIKNAWPAALDMMASELHALTDLLGNAHDLALLDLLICDDNHRLLPETQQTAVHELIVHRYENTLRQAGALAARLLAEKPNAFARRMKAYLTLWPEAHCP